MSFSFSAEAGLGRVMTLEHFLELSNDDQDRSFYNLQDGDIEPALEVILKKRDLKDPLVVKLCKELQGKKTKESTQKACNSVSDLLIERDIDKF